MIPSYSDVAYESNFSAIFLKVSPLTTVVLPLLFAVAPVTIFMPRVGHISWHTMDIITTEFLEYINLEEL